MYNIFTKDYRILYIQILLIGLITITASGQNLPDDSPDNLKTIRIAFYNVENLFHPSDDPVTQDDDFTPRGDYHWNYARYRIKLDHIGRCLALIGSVYPPAIIGLAEIENRKVLEDLSATDWLKKAGYKIIHKNSPDRRGIDVGLLFNPEIFMPQNYEMIGIDTAKYHIYSREMLYVSGVLFGNRIVHLFVVHWPSRRGGQIGSESRRFLVAGLLRNRVNSILTEDSLANIIIMGDFNDNPDDESLIHVLQALKPDKNSRNRDLINLMFPLAAKNEGSYCHLHNFLQWDNLDQIIVSGSLFLGKSGLKIKGEKAFIFRERWLLDRNGSRPFSTYLGPRYLGGFSDHLPVYLDLERSQ